MGKLVAGVGLNDSKTPTSRYIRVEGKPVQLWVCPFYKKWSGMLRRCYSDKQLKRNPTYYNCTVCDEWLTFSNFKAWMETQDWEGNELDKDILIEGNRVYSPEACVFVSHRVNSFMLCNPSKTSPLPVGVHWRDNMGKFTAQINLIEGVKKHLGYFDTVEEASKAWLLAKQDEARRLVLVIDDERVASAILDRFKIKDQEEMK